MRKSFDTLGVGDLQRQLGALDERLRVVRILRDLRPRDAVNDNEMASAEEYAALLRLAQEAK